jgi:hypothetical protein
MKKFKKFRGGRNREAGGDANQVFFLFGLMHDIMWNSTQLMSLLYEDKV